FVCCLELFLSWKLINLSQLPDADNSIELAGCNSKSCGCSIGALCGVVMYNYLKVRDVRALNQLPTESIPERATKVRRVCYKVFRSKLYRPIQVVCIGLTGYRYVDRPLSGGTIKTGVSPRRNKATLHLLARDEATPPSPHRNETTPHLPVRDEASPPLPARDEAMPPLPRRNEATSCLPARDEATPRLLAGEARENKVPPLLPVR
ncbi:hypothetical protein BHE74_00059637, partial [Ensete ventricosum]